MSLKSYIDSQKAKITTQQKTTTEPTATTEPMAAFNDEVGDSLVLIVIIHRNRIFLNGVDVLPLN